MKDTKENAFITLVNKQKSGAESEKIEFSSKGSFYKKEDVFHITYKEHSEMGMGDSRVFLKIEKDKITMRRMGEVNTMMSYELDRITEFLYRMPFGEMNIKIKTEKITNNLTEAGGTLDFSYILLMNGGEIYNDMSLSVQCERN